MDEEEATVRIRFACNGEFVPTKVKLLNAADKTVGTGVVKTFDGGAYTHQAVFTVKNPTLWNPEQPYLYTLLLETPDEVITDRIGFRTIHIENNMVFLNGNPIKFRGVNRHDSDPVTGPVISVEHMKRAVSSGSGVTTLSTPALRKTARQSTYTAATAASGPTTATSASTDWSIPTESPVPA